MEATDVGAEEATAARSRQAAVELEGTGVGEVEAGRGGVSWRTAAATRSRQCCAGVGRRRGPPGEAVVELRRGRSGVGFTAAHDAPNFVGEGSGGWELMPQVRELEGDRLAWVMAPTREEVEWEEMRCRWEGGDGVYISWEGNKE
jgi:hypothetical protein